ncbi:MAG: class I SAM-dependent methyltransferase, partial [Myxococcales bacterium]|nr:class I SAM-dependent methyltransferase [Myxococcales bacterium]
SSPALQELETNLSLNSFASAGRHESRCEDVFEVLRGAPDHTYDVVICDPPNFAKRADERDGALAAYRRLARECSRVLVPGGTLVSASCSSRVTPSDFFRSVSSGISAAGRGEEVIERTDHPIDHPASVGFPQYLKCQFARIR